MKFLPAANFASIEVGGSGRMPADEINELANDPRELSATVAARGALIPILYGRRDVPGLIFAYGKLGANLVVGYIWCVGETDAVEAIYLNDAPVPAGVTVTSYLGTATQGIDSTLAAAVAAYADTLRIDIPGGGKLGLCYSVVTITPGSISGFPRARAVIRGRKIYDPRSGLTQYTANPALMLRDLVTNPVFGIGRPVIGVEECANWCDNEIAGIVGAYRARSAIYIASGRPAEQYIDLLCEYAECLRIYEGDTIKLVPDAPVDLSLATVVGPADIIENTFSFTAESALDTPSEVELQYTEEPSTPSDPWGLTPTVVRLPGVTEGEVQRVPTSVTLDGVYRLVEASNKAQARLNRMQNRITANWTTLDIGVMHQKGDVFYVKLPARGIDMPFRLESVQMSSYGRYSVSATRYDISHYPNDVLPVGFDGVVPVGAIALLVGTVVPVGWTLYTAADGKLIVGAGGAYSVNASGGSTTTAAWNATTTPGGAHGSASAVGLLGPGGSSGGSYVYANQSVGDHTHTFTAAAVTADILRHGNQLVIKTGSYDVELPPAIRVFGLPNTNTRAEKIIAFAGRKLQAATYSHEAGQAGQTTVVDTTFAGAHKHEETAGYEINRTVFGAEPIAFQSATVKPSHKHTATVTTVFRLKRQQLCLFGSAGTYTIRAGMIFMWSGSIGSLPLNYVLCNGSSGTPDMRDRFVEFAADTPESPAGDNTYSRTASLDTDTHSHMGSGTATGPVRIGSSHTNNVSHTHTAATTGSFVPTYYALAFIMYAPAG